MTNDNGAWPEWSTREKRVALACALALAAITAIPPIYGALHGAAIGKEWTGLQVLSPGDIGVYLSYMRQAMNGAYAFANQYSTEAATPVVNVFWWAIGMFAKACGLSPLAAYHVSRTLLLFPFAFAMSWAISRFLRGTEERRAALLLLLFCSGIGTLFQPFLHYAGDGTERYVAYPIDLWVGESNAFLSALYSPHFVASWTLLVLAVALCFETIRTRSVRPALFGGLASAALFQFHPYYAPAVYVIAAVFIALAVRRDGLRALPVRALAFFFLLSAPVIAYHAWLVLFSENKSWMVDGNLLYTPLLPYVLAGFFGFVPLAFFGTIALRERGGEDRWRISFVLVWLVAQSALAYAPISFQRRFLEGLLFPLAVLAAPAAVAIVRRVTASRRVWAMPVAGAAAACILLPSSVAMIDRNVEAYRENDPPIFYRDRSESDALAWIREELPPEAVLLGSFETGYAIGGWGGHATYIGHWANTVDLARKREEMRIFFILRDDVSRAVFLEERGITHVYVGPRERKLGAAFDDSRALRKVYENGEVSIYEFTSI